MNYKSIQKFSITLLILTFITIGINATTFASDEEYIRSLQEKGYQQGLVEEGDPEGPISYSRMSSAAGSEKILKPGEIYFKGRSMLISNSSEPEDAHGHGVGMSQWGAFGAANKGWKAADIVKRYYTNTAVEARDNININVQFSDGNTHTMDMETYVSYLGEVPNNPCTGAGDPNSWSCWPREAIKAQILAAKSYAYRKQVDQGYVVTSTWDQVFREQDYLDDKKDGKATRNYKFWAAKETRDSKGKPLYIISKGATHNNDVVQAFYSANNNNGWGTADNDTVWNNKYTGVGTQYSYLRSVNDNDINIDVGITRRNWSTNSYNMDEINNMFVWCSQNCLSKDWVKANVVDNLKKVISISVAETDGSGRVKKVRLIGSNAKSTTISGKFFQEIFNVWITGAKPAGKTDDLFESLTFTINSTCPYSPVYRFWSANRLKHFYTSSVEERDIVIQTYPEAEWKYEGTAYCAPLTQVKDSKPVYRFYSEAKRGHFYTINEAEKEHVIKNDPSWKYEGIGYYAFSAPGNNLKPVYRFWSVSRQSHFYTINEAEKDNVIKNDPNWKYEGIAFYTVPN